MAVRRETRDIVGVVPASVEETRHVIEYAHCPSYGSTRCADTDLPAEGSYGRALVGTAVDKLKKANPRRMGEDSNE